MDNDAGKVNTEMIRVLEICRDIELSCAKLYRYFAEIFSSHQEMAELWHKTVREEENHARQFVMAIKLCNEQIIETLSIDGSTAKNMLNIVKSLHDEARKNKPSLLDSLRIAIKLEEDLAAFHMTTVANFAEGNHKKLFSAMMNADKDHVEELRQFYQRS